MHFIFARDDPAGLVPLFPAAVRWSDPGWCKDSGESLAPSAGSSTEPDLGNPHCLARLGRWRVAGGAWYLVGNAASSSGQVAGVRGAVWSWRGGRWVTIYHLLSFNYYMASNMFPCVFSHRVGGRGWHLAVPCLPAGWGATASTEISCSVRSPWETPDSTVKPSLAEGTTEQPRRSWPLDGGDSCRDVTMTHTETQNQPIRDLHHRTWAQRVVS